MLLSWRDNLSKGIKMCTHKKNKMSLRTSLSLLAMSISAVNVAYADELQGYEHIKFNPKFLMGMSQDVDLSTFESGNGIRPGTYMVSIYVNGLFLLEKEIEFTSSSSPGVSKSCIPYAILADAGIKEELITGLDKTRCYNIADIIKGAGEEINPSRMSVDLIIPQAYINSLARGYVPRSALDAGDYVGFINYSGSYFRNNYKNSYNNTNSTFFNFQSGINLGLWQFRNNSTLRNTNTSGTKYTNGNMYVQRAIPDLRSTLLIGESSTRGSLFDSVAFRGIRISSDERMLAPNQQGYAPVVRGVASSNARIVIRQAGNVIYETTVPPGDFVIDDLYPTRNSGDLSVEISEAGGVTRTFSVPFSSVSASLRQGLSRYSVTSGKTRSSYSNANDVNFIEGIYEKGLSNFLTVNSGLQFSDNQYSSVSFGGVTATPMGAIGYNANYSHFSNVNDGQSSKNGWQFKLSYNATYDPTGTSLMLAAYKYSTEGFISLNDSLAKGSIPYYYVDDDNVYRRSETYRQKSRFEISANQPLKQFGSIFVRASRQTYHDGASKNNQYQVGYQNTFGKLSYGVTASREMVYTANNSVYNNQNVYSVNVSIPFDFFSSKGVLSSGVTHYGKDGNIFQNNYNGSFGEQNQYNYSLNQAVDKRSDTNSYGMNLSRDTSSGTFGGGYSRQSNSTILSANGRGSVVAYGGGIVPGPYVSETFAIVEAEGAQGAQLTNTNGVKINRFGKAVVPSLSAYRYNNITLDPRDMDPSAELNETQKKVAPYAGAIPVVQFKTNTGYALLIDVTTTDGHFLPVGAQVKNLQGNEIGIVGQNSQLYIRVPETQGRVIVNYGKNKSCFISYDITKKQLHDDIIYLNSTCSG